MSSIEIKSPSEVESIRKACRIASDTLQIASRIIRAGVSGDEIDRLVHESILRAGARPANLNYHGFPKSCLVSINETALHGIPGPRRLVDGDIVKVSLATMFDGFHGQITSTFYVGEPTTDGRRVTELAMRALEAGVFEVREGARMGDIGAAIQECVESEGCSVIRAYVGHGIGRHLMEAPQVSHVGERGTGVRLRAGMVFTIQPQVTLGGPEVDVLDDGWTVVTRDGSLAAEFEHVVVVTPRGVEVLTDLSLSH
jgi:methionyl aminopeptidase